MVIVSKTNSNQKLKRDILSKYKDKPIVELYNTPIQEVFNTCKYLKSLSFNSKKT